MKIAAYPAKFVNASLVHFGNRSTHWLGKLAGEKFPYDYVSEHPRSGGTWAARMIADYLQVSFPWNPMLPLACRCVVHNHWAYSPWFRRAVYVYRDGRDVAVSTYFLGLNLKKADTMIRAYRLRGLLGPTWDAPDAFKNAWKYLPAFIENWVRRPFGCPVSWPEHIAQWLGRTGVTPLRYEDLLQDCQGTLTQALREHLGEGPDPERVRWAVEKFSFARMAVRNPARKTAALFSARAWSATGATTSLAKRRRCSNTTAAIRCADWVMRGIRIGSVRQRRPWDLMMNTAEHFYTTGEYAALNPTFHVEDSPWKAVQILRLLKDPGLEPARVCEVGCGAGEVLHQLFESMPPATHFEEYDISLQALRFCRNREQERLRFFRRTFSARTWSRLISCSILMCSSTSRITMDFCAGCERKGNTTLSILHWIFRLTWPPAVNL